MSKNDKDVDKLNFDSEIAAWRFLERDTSRCQTFDQVFVSNFHSGDRLRSIQNVRDAFNDNRMPRDYISSWRVFYNQKIREAYEKTLQSECCNCYICKYLN